MNSGFIFNALGKGIIIFAGVMSIIAYLTLAERKVVAYIQERYGPNRVGPFGLLQPIADGIKLIFKEEIIPQNVDLILYLLAPVVTASMALLPFAVIPFAENFFLSDINIGILYIISASILATYGIILGGWASPSKYSLLGGLRAGAQLISYEIPFGLAILGVVMMAGSLSLVDIVKAQKNQWFITPQFLGFIVALISIFAETNRLPFDLPEAESELVAGFHTEYSSFKFGLFFLGEYAHLVAVSALMTTLYLGGWNGPYLPGFIIFAIKTFLLIFLFMWVRWTFPRFRFDQLMKFGWKVLIPLALLNLLLTGLLKVVL